MAAIFMLFMATTASSKIKVICPDGEHYKIELKELSLCYEGWSFAGILSSLTTLSGRVDVGAKTLQQAAAATSAHAANHAPARLPAQPARVNSESI